MKLIVLACALAVASCYPHHHDSHDLDLNLEAEWTAFKLKYRKDGPVDNSGINRKAIFADNLKMIKRHNQLYSRGLKSYYLGVNRFADRTTEEISFLVSGTSVEKTKGGNTYLRSLNLGELPNEVDWRKEGLVTSVKEQAPGDSDCGSCWAFSTVGAIEGQIARKTGKLVELSTQELVDCSVRNSGCQGGFPSRAYQDIVDMGGIDTEESYPYEAKERGMCNFTKENIGAVITGYTQLPKFDEAPLKEAVATVGPLSIAVYLDVKKIFAYGGGVYDDEDCYKQPPNHGMVVVGYGTSEDGKDYWLVKNSWGTKWGEEGYIRMSRNKNNQCGIANYATYPTV